VFYGQIMHKDTAHIPLFNIAGWMWARRACIFSHWRWL